MTYEITIVIKLCVRRKEKLKVEYERDTQLIKSVKLANGIDIKDRLTKYEVEEVIAECEKVYLEQEQEMYWNGIE